MSRSLKNYYLWFSLLWAGFILAQDGPISLLSSVDKSLIHIGDLIQYTVVVTHDKEVRLDLPGLGANLGGFEIRDYDIEEPRKEDGKIVSQFNYTISTFFTGEFEIPPLTVTYFVPGDSTAKRIATEKIKIVVDSIKPSEAADIRDIKPPFEIPKKWWYTVRWFILGGGILFLGVMGFLIYWRRKQGKSILPMKPLIQRPPHELAYEELDRLKASDLLERGEIKLFYTVISEIIRRYIEGRYFIVAMELTTTEVLDGLSQADVSEEEYQIFQSFLDRCDLVKFAKVIPSDFETAEVIQFACNIIDRTKVIMEKSDGEASPDNEVEGTDKDEMEESNNHTMAESLSVEMEDRDRRGFESAGEST